MLKKTKGDENEGNPQRRNRSTEVKAPRFAARIAQAEWDDEVALTTIPKLQKALEEGEKLPGNLIITREASDIDEAQALLNAYYLWGRLVLR